MNDIDKIKLEIYESSLDIDTKYELVDIISESCDVDIIDEVYTILEASKKDADKIDDIGRRTLTLKKGGNISKEGLYNYEMEWLDEDDPRKQKPLNTPFHKSEIEKLSRRHSIRSSSRSENSVVPYYGANPKYSKDISDKSKKKYENSFRNRNYDLDKSLESISNDTKKRILKDRLSKGKDIPKSMNIEMVRKDYLQPVKSERETYSKRYSYFHKVFKSKTDPVLQKLRELLKIMKTETDYEKYKKAHDEFARLTGCNKTDSFGSVCIRGAKIEFYAYKDGKPDVSKNNDKFYHGSENGEIKSLTPTFRSTDGIFYSTPRIYFNKNKPGSKMGDGYRDEPKYNPKNKIQKSKVDYEINGASRYIETNRELPVKRIH